MQLAGFYDYESPFFFIDNGFYESLWSILINWFWGEVDHGRQKKNNNPSRGTFCWLHDPYIPPQP